MNPFGKAEVIGLRSKDETRGPIITIPPFVPPPTPPTPVVTPEQKTLKIKAFKNSALEDLRKNYNQDIKIRVLDDSHQF
jgi:hypothetical protein